MSYEPTNWQTGDVITAEKLNKLEQGVESADSTYKIWIAEDVTLDNSDPENPSVSRVAKAYSSKPTATVGDYDDNNYCYLVTWEGDVIETDEALVNYVTSGKHASFVICVILPIYNSEIGENEPKEYDKAHLVTGSAVDDVTHYYSYVESSWNPRDSAGVSSVRCVYYSTTDHFWVVRE